MANEINIVEVEQTRDNAVLLLAAAEELGHHPAVVETTSEGVFRVPSDVAEKAGLSKGGEKKASDKQVEAVTAEQDPFGDPFDGPEREQSSNTIHSAQPDVELAERQSDTKSGRSATKKTAAKKTASRNQKSE